VWEMVVFILNGLQLPQVLHALPPGVAIQVAKVAFFVVAGLVLVRFAWMFGSNIYRACSVPACGKRTACRGNRRRSLRGPEWAEPIPWRARWRFHSSCRQASRFPVATLFSR
jgi:NhaP-type Na+/H+ or K+/H+ antiporter